jgi:Uri superfamily endonuclease
MIAKIYKLVNDENGDIYVGSTLLSLKVRLCRHRNITEDRRKCVCYDKIMLYKHHIELIEEIDIECREELLIREQYWINKLDCINQNKSYRTKNEQIEYRKEWTKINKNRINKNKQIWRDWKNSWGGNYERNWAVNTENNLLLIDINLFK